MKKEDQWKAANAEFIESINGLPKKQFYVDRLFGFFDNEKWPDLFIEYVEQQKAKLPSLAFLKPYRLKVPTQQSANVAGGTAAAKAKGSSKKNSNPGSTETTPLDKQNYTKEWSTLKLLYFGYIIELKKDNAVKAINNVTNCSWKKFKKKNGSGETEGTFIENVRNDEFLRECKDKARKAFNSEKNRHKSPTSEVELKDFSNETVRQEQLDKN